MFVTFDGSGATNQYLSPPVSHILLSHMTLLNTLLLTHHDEKPYEYYPTGWAGSDGRSLLGSVRIKGGQWLKDAWECNFLCTPPQVDLFNQLLEAQSTNTPVGLVDRWVDGVVNTKSVWVDVDRQYLTMVAANSWWRLQFRLLEVSPIN